ncbi:hypothetical protein [Pedobacter foliorum]|uniref:hypothetical protein n=1 Tax=Pedobacter foliorum TaxID=2739058 RepID=UPI0015652727|nr:hypothetical protein [Pedobacter foliorum]
MRKLAGNVSVKQDPPFGTSQLGRISETNVPPPGLANNQQLMIKFEYARLIVVALRPFILPNGDKKVAVLRTTDFRT